MQAVPLDAHRRTSSARYTPRMAQPVTTSILATDFARVITRMRARLRREQSALTDRSLSQLAVLGRIAEEQPITATEVAAAEHVRQQSVAETVATLRTQGLIDGNPDPRDRRKLLLSLSVRGQEYVESIQAYRGAWLARAIDLHLTADERETLAKAVELMARLADAQVPHDD
jgi:DNA-binding MarR family transcriptional regulator